MLPVFSHASVTTGQLSVAAAELVVMFALRFLRTLLPHRIAVLLRPATRAFLLLTLLTPAHAQSTASIKGQVVDQLGAVGVKAQEFQLLAADMSIGFGTVVLLGETTFWELYKWHILGVGALLLLQTSLIAGLLVERARRSKATHGLSESEERYRNVVQTQTELICRYLPDTTITFVNDAYCRYFGKSRAELIGLKFIELIPEHARQDTLVICPIAS